MNIVYGNLTECFSSDDMMSEILTGYGMGLLCVVLSAHLLWMGSIDKGAALNPILHVRGSKQPYIY